MNILDKIALNRLVKIITDFIIAIMKIFAPDKNIDIVPTPPDTKRRFPWIRKKINDLVKEDTNE